MGKLGIGVKPELRMKYPHMMPEDTIIWKKFIENGLFLPDLVWYDVRVGRGISIPSGQPDWMQRMADYTDKKRIDMVWKTGPTWWVIEAKPFAGVVALGQALFYAELFEAEYVPGQPVLRGIITDHVDLDVKPIFDKAGIVVFEVGV